MSSITQLYSESNLIGYLNAGITASDTTITVKFYDKVTGIARTPQSTTKLFVIDKGSATLPNPNYEIVYAASGHSTSSGVTTMSGCVRGIALYGYSLASGTGSSHQSSAEVGCADIHLYNNMVLSALDGTNSPYALKLGVVPTFEGVGIFADRVFADATARDAAIVSPSNGMSCYLTSAGQAYDYIGGAWTARASGTNPNASETVAGKVEMATNAEAISGADTGGSGAPLVPTPYTVAHSVQDSVWTYFADAEASDAYAITPTAAIAAYAAGQRFQFKANTANTGPATLNVSSKGAVAIKKYTNQALGTGDIPAGGIIDVIHDGTNFQMQTPASTLDVQTFTSTGANTWTKPNWGTVARVQIWAGGGSGGQGVVNRSAGGGGGGAYNEAIFALSSLGATETVTIGAGGAAQSSADTDGNVGGNTTFGSLLSAFGGGGGGNGSGAGDGGGGGGGGILAVGTVGGDSAGGAGGGLSGGAGGGASTAGGSSTYGGGGGGGADTPAAGGSSFWGGAGGGGGEDTGANTGGVGGVSIYGGGGGGGGAADTSGATGGASTFGGAGGAGATGAAAATAGTQPAGGGGGAENGTSGKGGDGKCIVTIY